MQDFTKLDVYNLSYKLVLNVYKLTQNFPKSETYGVVSQIRRASTSIPANIAEGASRNTKNDFARFIQIAIGSTSELIFFVQISKDLDYLNETTCLKLLEDLDMIKRKLINFNKKLRQ